MPELPEVETYRRYLAEHALGQRIARVEVRDERVLGEIRRETFVKKLRGTEFTEARRHGKHLFARLSAGKGRLAELWLHLHFGMSGDLAYYREAEKEPRFARIVFAFENGAWLAFEDMRLFGLADLIASPDRYIADKGLGPDPLDPAFSYPRFAKLLERRKGATKSLLMTQEILAGLGNLYADETLFQTAIHPRRPVDKLRDTEKRAVFTAMRRILRDVIGRHERGADLPGRYLTMHREEGDLCPRCGGSIRRTVVSGRTTYFCGTHQR